MCTAYDSEGNAQYRFDGILVEDVVRKLADMDIYDFEKAVRAGKVGLVGYVFNLKPRELVKRVKDLRWRRIKWQESAHGQE